MTELIKALESADKTFGDTYPWIAEYIIKESANPQGEGDELHSALIGYRAGKEAMRAELEAHKAALANLCSFHDFSCLDRGIGSKTPDGTAWLTARALSIVQPAPNSPDSVEQPVIEALGFKFKADPTIPDNQIWVEFTPSPDNPVREGDEVRSVGHKDWRAVNQHGWANHVGLNFPFATCTYRRRVTNQEGK